MLFRTVLQKTPRPVLGAAPLVAVSPTSPPPPIILDGLSATYSLPHTNPTPPHCADARDGSGCVRTARGLWHGSCVARQSRHVRRARQVCVVGGAAVIERVWRTYGIQPHVVYVSQEAALPRWCIADHHHHHPPPPPLPLFGESPPCAPVAERPARPAGIPPHTAALHGASDQSPVILVRAPAREIRHVLLRATHSDGYAAEFPHRGVGALGEWVADAEAGQADDDGSVIGGRGGGASVDSVLVLVGVRIPSNAGLLLRAAVDVGFDHVICVNCVDVLQEKVIRASGGAVLNRRLRVYEHRVPAGGAASVVPQLTAVARRFHLHPILAVPSQSVPSASAVAAQLGFHPTRRGSGGGGGGGPRGSGVMLVLGAESGGLAVLGGGGDWAGVPYSVASLPLPNPFTDSYNVAVAGSMLMHLFRRAVRPAAAVSLPPTSLLLPHDEVGLVV